MSLNRYVRTVIAVAILVLTTSAVSAQQSTFRITNMSSTSLDAYIGDSALPLFSNLQPGGASSANVNLLTQLLLRITSSQDSSKTLFNGSLLASLTQSLNLVVLDSDSGQGGGSGLDTINLFSSILNTTQAGMSQLRFVNTTSSSLDFRITDGDGSVSLVSNVQSGAAVDFSTVSDGIAKIEVMANGTATVIFSTRDTLADRGRQTVFATGNLATDLSLRALDELDLTAQSSLHILARITGGDSNQSRRLRIVNLFDDVNGLSIGLNGEASDSLMFNEASEMINILDSLSAGFNIDLGLLGGGSIFSNIFDLSNRDSVTDVIALRGGLGAAQTITLRRSSSLGITGDSGMIRVLNASSTLNGMLDVQIIADGDSSMSSGLSFGQSGQFSLFHSGHFSVAVRQAGSATFDRIFDGNLNTGSALTLLVTGDLNDSASFGISVLNELDLSAQRPLLRLRNLFGNDSTGTRRFRAVQLVADLTSRIDIMVDDSTVIRNLGYREASNMVTLDLSSTVSATIGVLLSGTGTHLIDGLLNIGGTVNDSAAFTTMYSIGSIQAATSKTVSLETRSSDAGRDGRAKLRVFNAVAADATAGTGGGYDLSFDFSDGGSLTVDNLHFGEASEYRVAASGAFTLHIMHNDDSTTMQTVQGSLAANSSFTLALSDKSAGANRQDDRALNSAAPTVDALLLQDMVGNAPAVTGGPIPMLGQVSSVGSAEIATGLRVVPNPVKDVANLRYGLATSRTVTITLLDVKGAVAATFEPGIQTPGTYEVNLGVAQLPMGTYTAVLFDEHGNRLGSTRLVIAR